MTEGLSAGPADPVAPEGTPVSRISPGQYAWLDQELAAWRAQGLVSEPAERAIRSRYVADRRLSLITVVSGLGAAFVASGVIWLVAANLDRLSPVVRFTLVAAGWLGGLRFSCPSVVSNLGRKLTENRDEIEELQRSRSPNRQDPSLLP